MDESLHQQAFNDSTDQRSSAVGGSLSVSDQSFGDCHSASWKEGKESKIANLELDLHTVPDLTFDSIGQTARCNSPVLGHLFDDDSLHDEKQQLKTDQNAVAGLCGLRNLGNTCFMNSGLQCLFSSIQLGSYFLEKFEMDSVTKNSLTGNLAKLVAKVWSGKYNCLSPSEFKQCLGDAFPQFTGFRQHDSQEFLALLLDSLHEELNNSSGKFSSSPSLCGSDIAVDERIDEEVNDAQLLLEKQLNKQVEDESNLSSVSLQSSDAMLSVAVTNLELKHSNSSNLSLSTCNSEHTLPLLNSGIENNGAILETEKLTEKLMHISPRSPEKNELATRKNAENILPAGLEEFYLKDSKVANTNVLIMDHGDDICNIHSSKFSKLPAPTPLTFDNLHGTTPCSVCKNMPHSATKLKDTNLHVKIDTCPQDVDAEIASQLSSSNLSENFAINNCKRDRLEDDEKPMILQKKFKNSPMPVEEDLKDSKIGNLKGITSEPTVFFAETRLHDPGKTLATFDLEMSECEASNNAKMSIYTSLASGSKDFGSKEESRLCSLDSMASTSYDCQDPVRLDLEMEEADKAWCSYLSRNKSVVVDTFQGQFKSTVICSKCGHVSKTFEPFMYLSLPLPRAMEYQIAVIFIRCDGSQPMRYLLTLHRTQSVSHLKEALLEITEQQCEIYIAEVVDNHVSRFLEENLLLRLINDTNHTVYAFEIQLPVTGHGLNLTTASTEDVTIACGGTQAAVGPPSGQWKSCSICLEEMMDAELFVHPECGCTLCQVCINMSYKHYGGDTIPCPVCNENVGPDVFIPIERLSDYQPKIRTLPVSIVFRHLEKDGEKAMRFGHPRVACLPRRIMPHVLYEFVQKMLYDGENYTIALTDAQGMNCSRCSFTRRCYGCPISLDTEVVFMPGDHITVTFSDPSPSLIEAMSSCVNHESAAEHKLASPLNLIDCFKAFSEREILDEHNPWYCTRCQKNQRAEKTMTVWRCPPTLIVYLKRFVFHEHTSLKLDNRVVFPLDHFDLSQLISGPFEDNLSYDLHSCVCHFGGPNAGHYTAYAKHLLMDKWYYYNDERVVLQTPIDDDYSNAYILFYQRSGSEREFVLPENISNFQDDVTYSSLVPFPTQPISHTIDRLLQDLAEHHCDEMSKDAEEEGSSSAGGPAPDLWSTNTAFANGDVINNHQRNDLLVHKNSAFPDKENSPSLETLLSKETCMPNKGNTGMPAFRQDVVAATLPLCYPRNDLSSDETDYDTL